MNIEETIHEFLRGELLDPDVELLGTSRLLEDGLINSVAALRLAGFVDETFGIELDAGDFTIENFATIDDLAALVRRKQ